MFSFQELTDKVNRYIESNPYKQEPQGLYEPINYILSLGGKRVRPVLMLMAYNMYKDDVETILGNAIAIETYHNFTLVHDDLMDKSDLRRGNQTVHKKWDENTAILSGDTMLILAYKLFTDSFASHSNLQNMMLHAQKTFMDVTLGVCDGQQYDMEFEKRNNVTEVEYMEMIRVKTSVRLAGTLKMNVEVETPPRDRETETVDQARTARGTNGANVTIVDDTVAIDILIFNITGLHRAELLYRAVADIIVVLEESEGDEAAHLIDAIAILVLISVNVVLLVVLVDAVLAVSDVSAYGEAHVAELVIVGEVAVETA